MEEKTHIANPLYDVIEELNRKDEEIARKRKAIMEAKQRAEAVNQSTH